MYSSKFAYLSFDVVPAPKGAATHIIVFSKAIAREFDNLDLVTIAAIENNNFTSIDPKIQQVTLPAKGKYFIDRVLYFQMMLKQWQQDKIKNNIQYNIVHFRSIFEGFLLVNSKQKIYRKMIFEVNGLPSIELKYRYPKVVEDRDLMYKLRTQEDICLNAADLIITPSEITKDYLQNSRQIKQKIKVIPNGVDTDLFTYRKSEFISKDSFKLLYFGTLSSWQGVHLAIEALALINRDLPTTLNIIGLGRDRQIKKLNQLASKLKIEHLVTINPPLNQQELVKQIHNVDAVIAPLTANDRNIIQGCCPLKILETMATGTPIITSDLPVVKELGLDREHFLLVKPNSAKSIKDAVLFLIKQPQLQEKISLQARNQIENKYSWKQATDSLITSYYDLLNTI